MNNYGNRKQMRLLLLLAVTLLLTMTTAIAGATGKKAASCDEAGIDEHLKTISACKDATKSAVEKSNQKLSRELLSHDSSLLTELENKEDLQVTYVNRPIMPQSDITEPGP